MKYKKKNKRYWYEGKLYITKSKNDLRRKLNIGYNDVKKIKQIKEVF